MHISDTVPINFIHSVGAKDSVAPKAGPSHCPGRPLPTLESQLPPLQDKYKDIQGNNYNLLPLPSQQGVIVEDQLGIPLICVICHVIPQETQVGL